MRKALLLIAALMLVTGVAIAKDELEKPVVPFESNSRATEAEPNDDHTTANPLVAGDDMNAAIDPAGDVDFFAFDALAGDNVTFETHAGDAGDTKMYLYDTDGVSQLAFDDDGGVGYYSLINFEFTADGTYFIMITHYSSSGTGTYILTAAVYVPPEPPVNPTCETAIDLQEQGETVFATNTCLGENNYSPTNSCTGYSSANGEDIVYKIDLLAGEEFSVTLTDETYDAAIHMWTDCADPNSCVAGGDDPEEFSYVAEADGTYYLIVDGYSGCGDALVTINAPVANDVETWSGVKSMYR